jgi:hypothetical protein
VQIDARIGISALLNLYFGALLKGVQSKSLELSVRMIIERIKTLDLNAIIHDSGYANKIVTYLATSVFYAPTVPIIEVKTSV